VQGNQKKRNRSKKMGKTWTNLSRAVGGKEKSSNSQKRIEIQPREDSGTGDQLKKRIGSETPTSKEKKRHKRTKHVVWQNQETAGKACSTAVGEVGFGKGTVNVARAGMKSRHVPREWGTKE